MRPATHATSHYCAVRSLYGAPRRSMPHSSTEIYGRSKDIDSRLNKTCQSRSPHKRQAICARNRTALAEHTLVLATATRSSCSLWHANSHTRSQRTDTQPTPEGMVFIPRGRRNAVTTASVGIGRRLQGGTCLAQLLFYGRSAHGKPFFRGGHDCQVERNLASGVQFLHGQLRVRLAETFVT